MGYSSSDAAHGAADDARSEETLNTAFEAARAICESFGVDQRGSSLSPTVSVNVEAGAEDQWVLVFTLLVELDDDLDPEDFPEDEIERLQSDLRARAVETSVDEWDWIITTGTKAGAGRQ